MKKLATIALTAIVGTAIAATVSVPQAEEMKRNAPECFIQESSDPEAGDATVCITSSDRDGLYHIKATDNFGDVEFSAFCAAQRTGYRGDQPQTEDYAREYCNGVRLQNGLAEVDATFTF